MNIYDPMFRQNKKHLLSVIKEKGVAAQEYVTNRCATLASDLVVELRKLERNGYILIKGTEKNCTYELTEKGENFLNPQSSKEDHTLASNNKEIITTEHSILRFVAGKHTLQFPKDIRAGLDLESSICRDSLAKLKSEGHIEPKTSGQYFITLKGIEHLKTLEENPRISDKTLIRAKQLAKAASVQTETVEIPAPTVSLKKPLKPSSSDSKQSSIKEELASAFIAKGVENFEQKIEFLTEVLWYLPENLKPIATSISGDLHRMHN